MALITIQIRGGQGEGERPLITFTAPVAYQEIEGAQRPVQVAYRLLADAGDGYGCALGAYDCTRPLVIPW